MKRRQFLAMAGATAGAGMLGVVPRLARASGPFTDYRALVNVFLYGGNDAFNLVLPRSGAEYASYAASRQNLAVPGVDVVAIHPDNPDGASYGFHPAARGLRDKFEAGDLAVISNVGPLIEPVTKEGILDNTVAVPPELFSHNSQQAQWQSLRGTRSLSTGWAGRIADSMVDETAAQVLPVNVSLSGNSLLQSGSLTVPYSVTPQGARTIGAFAADVEFGPQRRAAFLRHLADGFDNVHGRALGLVHQRALALSEQVNEALGLVPALSTPFPDTELGDQLKMIARLLAVREEFDVSRQIFYASKGGFDTHDTQNALQPGLFSDLNDSLLAFADALDEIGISDRVVTFTQSDFGRTLTSNGDGTDHGWGAHQLVMGGPVLGRRIVGTMPVLEIDGPDDLTGGRVIPTLSSDQYVFTLARWFGVNGSALADIAPDIANFPVQDLGFLS